MQDVSYMHVNTLKLNVYTKISKKYMGIYLTLVFKL